MFSGRKAFKIVDGVIGFVLVAMVHDIVRREDQVPIPVFEKLRCRIVLEEPTLHHEAMLKDVSLRRRHWVAACEYVDVPFTVIGPSAFPCGIILTNTGRLLCPSLWIGL